MNKKKNVESVPSRKFKSFLILIVLVIGIIFLFRQFSDREKVSFSLRRKGDDKIEIYGLKEEEVDKIDWDSNIWTYWSNNKHQYRFCAKKNFFVDLIKKPIIYHTISEVTDNELRNKKIQLDKFPNKQIVINKTEFLINSRNDVFEEKSWKLKDFLGLVFFIIIITFLLYNFDNAFGTNILGFASYPFQFLRRAEKGITISNVKFKDVGGLHEAKEELKEVILYFQNPQEFQQRNAIVPKGFLLYGPPGNGKTLLAKALAGECNLPFLFRSGSEFSEMLVGIGARRVRELFNKAKSLEKVFGGCIIFIDEIDSIGKKRYTQNSDDLTLNQLLNELDGFRSRGNIIVLAATNSLKVLDSALIRTGRFDRHICISLPNSKGRREIIDLQSKKFSLHPDFDPEEVTAMTKGLSGSQISSIFNEASILSIRYRKRAINNEMILEAHDRVLMGPSISTQTLTLEKDKKVSFHEAGHAIVGLSMFETVVKKITIVPRGIAGGYTWVDLRGEQESDDNLLSKKQMLATIMVSLGGRASEELIFGPEQITIGAYDDFKRVSQIIRGLIINYGMSDLGIIPTRESLFYGEEILEELPETTKQKIENEREKIMDQCWKEVKGILRKKKHILKLLAKILLEKRTLLKSEIDFIFINQLSPFVPLLN